MYCFASADTFAENMVKHINRRKEQVDVLLIELLRFSDGKLVRCFKTKSDGGELKSSSTNTRSPESLRDCEAALRFSSQRLR